MTDAESVKDEPFTTIRIRKYDRDRLNGISGEEPYWVTIRKMIDAFVLNER
jgi:hypothetical protein